MCSPNTQEIMGQKSNSQVIMWLFLAQRTSKINLSVKTRRKFFYFGSGQENLRPCYMGVQQGANVITGVFLQTQSENNNQNGQILLWIGMFAWQVQPQGYSAPLLSHTFHVFMKRTPSDHWPSHAWQHTTHGMITLSDEKTLEDDTGVIGWKSACRGAKHFS